MVNFYIYYNTHTHTHTYIYKYKNNGKPKNSTTVLTDTEIYCSTGQTGTTSSTRLTPVVSS